VGKFFRKGDLIMNIREAIEYLEDLESKGSKQILMYVVTADDVWFNNDSEWEDLVEKSENDLRVWDVLSEIIEENQEEEIEEEV
jgi:uncharacterized membrane protein (UPF0182 family)